MCFISLEWRHLVNAYWVKAGWFIPLVDKRVGGRYKNSPRDEVVNVNLFTTISLTYFKIPKKENLLRLENCTIARQVLHIKSWTYKSATDFPPCSYRIFIPHWVAVSTLTNNRTFDNQLHAAGTLSTLDWYQNRWPWITLNIKMALILSGWR